MDSNLDPKQPAGQVVELSTAELDAISGGLVNVSFTLMVAEDSHEFVAQEFASGGQAGMSVSGQRQRSRFGLQFSGTFESMGHFSSFFSRLTGFLGGR